MKIYLDVSCLNRPFDDQSQHRVRLESEAVTIILEQIDRGKWQQVTSRMAELEILAISDNVRRRRVVQILGVNRIGLSQTIFDRARQLVALGLGAADSVHVAAAEAQDADVLLTCDDRLLRRCQRLAGTLTVRVANPIDWLMEQNDESNT